MLLISLLLLSMLFLGIYLKFHKRVPILMYHRLANVPGDRNALPPDTFKEQLDYLSHNGFTTITMQMLYDYYQHGKKLPAKPVLLTFDDGYEDNFSVALPLLIEKQMVATVFPISAWIGKENKWENFNKKPTMTMDWAKLHQWKSAGMEIGSHTVNHPFLPQCSKKSLAIELEQSKFFLETELKCTIDFICYPYGSFNAETIKAVNASGYKAAFAIFDHVPLWQIDMFALPRIPIPARQSLAEFKLKVSSIHVIFIALRQWERIVKNWLRK